MNLAQLWQIVMMLVGAGAAMETLRAGGELHTGDPTVGISPVYTTWRDGRKFEIDFRIKRTA